MTLPSRNQAVAPTDPQPLYAVIAAYDVTTIRPERDVALLFRDTAVSLSAELEALRVNHSATEVELATAREREFSLRHQLATLRRLQMIAGALTVLGATLVGFGVNYLTSDMPTPGWSMLIVGGLLQLGAIIAPLVDRDQPASP